MNIGKHKDKVSQCVDKYSRLHISNIDYIKWNFY